jgi:hypothetical protein
LFLISFHSSIDAKNSFEQLWTSPKSVFNVFAVTASFFESARSWNNRGHFVLQITVQRSVLGGFEEQAKVLTIKITILTTSHVKFREGMALFEHHSSVDTGVIYLCVLPISRVIELSDDSAFHAFLKKQQISV